MVLMLVTLGLICCNISRTITCCSTSCREVNAVISSNVPLPKLTPHMLMMHCNLLSYDKVNRTEHHVIQFWQVLWI